MKTPATIFEVALEDFFFYISQLLCALLFLFMHFLVFNWSLVVTLKTSVYVFIVFFFPRREHQKECARGVVARSWVRGENAQLHGHRSRHLQRSFQSPRFHLHPEAALQTAEHQSNSVPPRRPGALGRLPSAPDGPSGSHVRCGHDQRHPQLGAQRLHRQPPADAEELRLLRPRQLSAKLPQRLRCTGERGEKERAETKR